MGFERTSRFWSARNRLSRRSMLRGAGVGVAGLTGAALIGCGGDEEETPGGTTGGTTDGATGTPAGATGTAAAGAVQTGGHLRVAFGLEPSSLDPHQAVSGGDDYSFNGIFDTLLAYNAEGELDPDRALAESHEVVDDTTLVFNLRQGIKFHDGTDFNAEAVKFTLERAMDPELGSIAFSALQSIDTVETPDEHTVRILLKQPDPDLVYNLGGRYGGYMLSPAAVEKHGDQFGANPVGTGPFTFVEWASGSHVAWQKNPDYWRKDENGQTVPYLDQVTIRIISDSTTALAALQTGDVHISGINAKDVPQVEGDGNLQLLRREGSGLASVIIFNKSIPPFDNVDLRRAIVWGVNPESVNQAVYFNRYIVADGWGYPPGTWAYAPIEGRPTYDADKAKQYLADAGYADGVDFTAVTYSSPTLVQQTEVYQEQLRQLGINMNVETGDVGQATQDFFQGGKYPMYSTSWSLKVVPDTLVSPTLSKDGYYNPAKETDPELQAMIDEAKTIYDVEERKAIYNQIGKYAMDQALYVPMLYSVAHVGLRQDVNGLDHFWTDEARWKYDRIWLTT